MAVNARGQTPYTIGAGTQDRLAAVLFRLALRLLVALASGLLGYGLWRWLTGVLLVLERLWGVSGPIVIE